MSSAPQSLEICVEQAPHSATTPRERGFGGSDRPPAFVSGVREGQYPVEDEEGEGDELLPAYPGLASGDDPSSSSFGRKLYRSRPLVRYISAAASALLLLVVLQLGYCHVQVTRQLSQADASLALAGKRGYALAARVAWLESALELNGVRVPVEAVSSAAPGELGPVRWRDTVDLAVAASALQERLEETQEALAWCHAVKGTGSRIGNEERRREVFG